MKQRTDTETPELIQDGQPIFAFEPEREDKWPMLPVRAWSPKPEPTFADTFAKLAERCGLA